MSLSDTSLRERKTRELNEADPNAIPETSDPVQSVHRDHSTLTWMEIPAWQRDNEYILTGYRREQFSWRGCAYSVFGVHLHNETDTPLRSTLFVGLLGTFYQVHLAPYETTAWQDLVVFVISLSAAIFCLLASSWYHTFSVHSREVAVRCHALDYAGIVVLTVGSFFPCVYYEFYCDTRLQAAYLSVIVLVGLGAAYIVLDPEYSKPTHRGARTKVFIALGLSAVFPVAHGFFVHGLQKLWTEMGFGWLIASGALYISGALLYANRIPERFSPGTFDYFFASHQIFHVCVVLAALSHYVCVLTSFEHWHARAGPFCPS
ncbi:hemolysin-III related-domain-containing protein [Fomitopsis serialis]|uniref:hemolysin-III related-domain-containing protein n=1 Tax=Fomitopsis serialis TaxID=139415 RepID=UPI002008682B|nr:hemolysin-III related-domain-containing protein [Neoantrodia serialis]KAH9919822.1 hemolysin-III related-domain-containing protein [Neoantrodia serialis]